MEVAKTGKGIEEEGGAVFDVTKFQLDYLTTPSGFLDIGIDYNKTDITTRACQSDELFIIAYPHFNVNGGVLGDLSMLLLLLTPSFLLCHPTSGRKLQLPLLLRSNS